MKIGIYQSYWGVVGGGQRYIAVVAEFLAREHDVEIVHHCEGFTPESVEEPMQVDLSTVRFRCVPAIQRPNWPTSHPLRRLQLERDLGREISEPYDLFIDSSDIPPFFNHARRGALLIHFPLVSFEEYHGHTTDNWQSHHFALRWLKNLFHRHEWKQRFASYDGCMVNSEFTRHWIKRLWGLDAKIVFPPLRAGLNPQSKRQTILSIGAIRAAQHKKQTVTLNAFKSLCDAGLAGWRYVMMGASGSSRDDQDALNGLRDLAAGYPIDIRNDVSGAELKDALETSSILWHSMGYGVDAEIEPRRMEHFGMVATEALAAGCIPVVFNGGGLREIITNGKTGYLWSTPEELQQQTLRLTGDEERRRVIGSAAVEASRTFAGPAFEVRLMNALAPLLDPMASSTSTLKSTRA